MKNIKKGSVILWIILAIVLVVVIGAGVIATKNSQVSQSQNNQVTNTTTPVTTTLYSYSLPSGWQSMPDSVQDMKSNINKTTGDSFSIITNTLSTDLAKATSITQIMTTDDISKVVQSNFPGAIISNVSRGTIDGENAYVVKFSRTSTETFNGQRLSGSLSTLQYSAIHNGVAYSLVFMTTSSRQAEVQPVFQFIINSFKFK